MDHISSQPTLKADKAGKRITRRAAVAAAIAGSVVSSIPGSQAAPLPNSLASRKVKHRTISVDGVEIFYREAGAPDAPVLLLLHGFPASSHMFRHLIPALSDRWRVIAPDYPGFGHSGFPPRQEFNYTFASFASVVSKFTDALGLSRFAIYIQDYGAPVGLRLALLQPDRISAMIVQNGNAYAEGLSDGWVPLKAYWSDPSQANRDKMQIWLDADGVRQQYVAGMPAETLELFSPDSWTQDWSLMSRGNNVDVQLDLFYDYRTNVELYRDFQRFFRQYQPPTLIVWGRHDPFFTVAGAEAYRRDIPRAELHILDAGHFALETHLPEIASLARDFLDRLDDV
ncbi:MAG: alpha/beta fold hydrolase [Rhizobiaceae bacterium]